MIQGVGSVDREIESVLPPAKISLRNFVCFYYKVKNTITTHDKANCCLMVRKIGLKVQHGDDGVDDDHTSYLSFFFTQAKFLENKIYTEIYTVNCQFTQ